MMRRFRSRKYSSRVVYINQKNSKYYGTTSNRIDAVQPSNYQRTHPELSDECPGSQERQLHGNLTALVANNKRIAGVRAYGRDVRRDQATALDLPLDPNLGFAYVIPYKTTGRGAPDAQFQIGAKGFIQLAIRSGQFKTLNVSEVKEGEIVDENLITGEITFKKAENRDAPHDRICGLFQTD